jgi:Do/DeqQ family serine protease
MKTPVRRFLAGSALLAAGICGGLLLSAQIDIDSPVFRNPVHAGPFDAPKGSSALTAAESPFVAVAEKVVPAVVAISTTAKMDEGQRQPFHPWGDPFGFEDLFPNDPRRPEGQRRIPGGSGSGFFMDERGYILTNNHVVRNASEVTIMLSDGTEMEAKVVGQDPDTDVAVVKVESTRKISTLLFGDSDAIRPGDWAIAVGNPFGQLQGSLTVGVISAKGRSDLNIMGGTPVYQSFIQTDASINFGNSGGPLVNIHGEVIGMNTAINPAGQGIGFAIPINMVKHVAEELIKSGKVVRGYLGIYPQALTPELAEGLEIPETKGILIGRVVEDTPADKAGLERGDVVTRLNGDTITDVNEFRMRVADLPVGDKIKLETLRDGKKRNVEVVLEARPTQEQLAQSEEGGADEWAGLRVEDLGSERARRFTEDPDETGVMVVSVDPGSPADDAGVQPGDIVKEIGNMTIRDLDDYSSAVKKFREKKAVAFLLKRGNQTLYVGLKL